MTLIKKKSEIEVHSAPPVTRRDFLGRGLIGAGAVATLPAFLGMTAKQAIASSALSKFSDPTPTLPALPMIVFDMAGGASMPGNFLAGGPGGSEDLLTKYDHLGWDPRAAGALDSQFGIPMSAKYSKILAGIVSAASPEARKNFRMGGLCHSAQDDSSSNPMNAAGLVLKSTMPGSKIANGIGLQNSSSGGNSEPALKDLSLKPTYVSTLSDFLGAVSFGGESFRGFSLNMLRGLAMSGKDLAKLQVKAFEGTPGGDIIKALAEKAYSKGGDLIDGASALDPRNDPTVAAVYKITPQSAEKSPDVLGGLVANATLLGISGPSTYTITGCDYHDGTQETGDERDMAAGVKIGQAIELAYRLKQPLFFQLLTDGGVDAEVGTREWRGDSGDKCMTIVGFYHPKAAPKLIRTQVGNYTNGQGAENRTLIGANPQLAGYAVFANYLNCLGRLGEFHNFLPGVFAEAGQLDSVLLFEGMPA